MQGYVVCLCDVGSTTPISYWDGTDFHESLDKSKIFTTRVDAKSSTAGMLSIYPDKDFIYVPARQTITLGTAGTMIENPLVADTTKAA